MNPRSSLDVKGEIEIFDNISPLENGITFVATKTEIPQNSSRDLINPVSEVNDDKSIFEKLRHKLKHIWSKNDQITKNDSLISFIMVTSIPFFVTGIGEICAGLLLAKFSTGSFLTQMNEAMIIIPPLCGLKGNLESTLGSRLATWAHLGLLNTRQQKFHTYIACATLDQAQALIIGFLAAVVATIFYLLQNGSLPWDHVVALYMTAVVTSSATSFLFSGLMFSVAMLAMALKINPDNIATPFAAMIGDCVTLSSFVFFGTLINAHRVEHGHVTLYIIITILFVLSSFFWMYITSKNPLTRQVLKTGWFSVITAMCFSTTAGYILRNAYNKYPGVANFQPVMAGVGGNMGSIQSSRICTYLHKHGVYGTLPANRLLTYLNPLRVYSCKEDESKKALALASMLFPGNFIFLILIFTISIGSLWLWNWLFCVSYLIAAFIHVTILLYVAQLLSRVYWRLKINPDNNTIPILTAFGDLFGNLLLMMVFVLLAAFGYQQWEDSLA